MSAFLTTGGRSHAALSAAERSAFVPCLPRAILDGTGRSLRDKVKTIRRHYTYPDERIDAYMADLAALAEHTTDLPELRVVPRDPKDDMIVATAVKAGADYLVTGDRHLLSLGAHQGIRTRRACLARKD